jgi:hypothetical protein
MKIHEINGDNANFGILKWPLKKDEKRHETTVPDSLWLSLDLGASSAAEASRGSGADTDRPEGLFMEAGITRVTSLRTERDECSHVVIAMSKAGQRSFEA